MSKDELYRCKHVGAVLIERCDYGSEQVMNLTCSKDSKQCNGCEHYAADAGTDFDELTNSKEVAKYGK